MFRHVRVIIREFFRACWVTCESDSLVDKTLRYTLPSVCYAEAWHAPICLVTLPSVCSAEAWHAPICLGTLQSLCYSAARHAPIWLVTLPSVCYAEAWHAPICLVTLPSVCYAEAWHAPICLVIHKHRTKCTVRKLKKNYCVTFCFYGIRLLAPRPTPNSEDIGIYFCLDHYPRPVWHA
jgi:hypothetical protein